MLNLQIYRDFNLNTLLNQIGADRDYDYSFLGFFTSPISVDPIINLEVFTDLPPIGGAPNGNATHISGWAVDGMAFLITGSVPVIPGPQPRIDLRAEIDAVGVDISFNFGGSSSTPIRGGATDDRLRGSDEADNLLGRGGDDVIYGNGGDDLLRGNAGDDLIFAGEGEDVLAGGAGEDILVGDAGTNILRGGADDDVLIGAVGENRMVGGAGEDAFVFVAGLGEGRQALRDWEAGERLVMLDAGTGAVVALADIAASRLADGARQFTYHDQTVVVQGGGAWKRDMFIDGVEAEMLLLTRVGADAFALVDDELGSSFADDLFII